MLKAGVAISLRSGSRRKPLSGGLALETVGTCASTAARAAPSTAACTLPGTASPDVVDGSPCEAQDRNEREGKDECDGAPFIVREVLKAHAGLLVRVDTVLINPSRPVSLGASI